MLVEIYFSIMREFGDELPRCLDFFSMFHFFGKELRTTIRADVEAPPGGATGENGGGGVGGGLNNTYSLFGIGTSAPGEPAPPTNSCFTFPSCAAVRLSSC